MALLVACVAARHEVFTNDGASVLKGSDVNATVNGNFMTTAGYRLLD